MEIKNLNNQMQSMTPFERLEWAVKTFGDKFCVTSSFGIYSAIMAHIVSKVDQSIPILFIDTGHHFAETLAYKDYLQQKLNLNIITLKPELIRMEFEATHGYAYECDPDLCCLHNKVLPLKKALENYQCWATGIRRAQGGIRTNISYFRENQNQQNTYKLMPIADYTDDEANNYLLMNELPAHPLVRKGYTSVGCVSCTRKAEPGENSRSGRWSGRDKTECGIHLMHGEGDGI